MDNFPARSCENNIQYSLCSGTVHIKKNLKVITPYEKGMLPIDGELEDLDKFEHVAENNLTQNKIKNYYVFRDTQKGIRNFYIAI